MTGGGRYKGGNKDDVPLILGDLVLAKVKGYPAWPAKISNPGDWQRIPDPKKYFVHFFGTQEITTSAPAPRSPSRAERAVDDPLREMEGMLVNEYGSCYDSNATFQLPGLLSSRAFEEEKEVEEDHEELITSHGQDLLEASPVQSTPASGDQRRYEVTGTIVF